MPIDTRNVVSPSAPSPSELCVDCAAHRGHRVKPYALCAYIRFSTVRAHYKSQMDQTTIHVSFISPLTAHLCGAPDIRALRVRTGMCARTTNGPDHISFISPPSPSLRRTGHTRFARTYRCVRAHYKWTRPSPSHPPISAAHRAYAECVRVCARALYV